MSATQSSTTVAASRITATISYNATNQSYTITSPGGSITFTPADIDNSQSNAGAVVYSRQNGSTTDSLTLTRPGTSGPLTYRYVGSAFWQRSNIGSTSGSGSIDAIAYGVATPAAAVPTSGTADFAVDVLGAQTIGPNVGAFTGTGTASIDFASGTVVIVGTIGRVVQGGTTTFTSSGNLTSGANAFSGNFSYTDFGIFNGTIDGKLFGPAGEEIGAAFQAYSTNNYVSVGTITGRRSTAAPANSSFPLSSSQTFNTTQARLGYTAQTGAINNDIPDTFRNQSAKTEALTIRYDAASQTYSLIAPDRSETFKSDSTAVSPTSSDTFVQTGAQSLQYVRSAKWNGANSHFVFGMPTASSQLVRSGNAAFALEIVGTAADNGYKNEMGFIGSGVMLANLAAGTLDLSGSLNFSESWNLAGRPRETANGSLTGSGSISSSANSFSGNLSFGGIGNYTGTFMGQFYGPGGEELGAIFTAADGADRAVGSIKGKRDASLLSSQVPLANLTAPTTFSAFTVHSVYVGRHDLTWNPTTGAYTFAFPNIAAGLGEITHSFGAAEIVAAETDASKTTYQHSGSEGTVNGYIFKATATNPVLALSYVSFADFQFQNSNGGLPSRLFATFGIGTPIPARPKAGTANYTGIARGYGTVASLGYSGTVAGTSALQANFGTGTVNLSVELALDDPGHTPLGTFSAPGQIANDSFFGQNGYSGDFFGPNAEEFGATWHILDSPPGGQTSLSVVAVGKRVP